MSIYRHNRYFPNEDIIVRQIEGEYLLLPIASGIGDDSDEIYTLNETGIAIWEKLSPEKTLDNVIDEICMEYSADKSEIMADVIGLMQELFNRKIVICC